MTINNDWSIQTNGPNGGWQVKHPPTEPLFHPEDSLWPRKALDSFYMGNPQVEKDKKEFKTVFPPKLDKTMRAKDTQVGGTHYRTVSNMQPWDIVDAWKLDFYEGNVVKYILRAKHKGSQLDDYKKAKHYIERLIEQHENNS